MCTFSLTRLFRRCCRKPWVLFHMQDIDSILSRCQTLVHSDAAAAAAEPLGSSFSKAHFVSEKVGEVDIDDPEFWTKAVGLQAAGGEEFDDFDDDEDGDRGVRRKVCCPLLHVPCACSHHGVWGCAGGPCRRAC